MLYSFVKLKHFTPGVNVLELKSNRKSKSENSHESHELRHFWRGIIFLGGSTSSGGKMFQPLKTIVVFLTFSGMGVKFSRWGKNPPGGHK